jgi:hypothetical protein
MRWMFVCLNHWLSGYNDPNLSIYALPLRVRVKMGHRIQNHFLLKLQPIIYLNKLFKIPNLSLRKPLHCSVPPGPTAVPVMMSRRTWHFQGKPSWTHESWPLCPIKFWHQQDDNWLCCVVTFHWCCELLTYNMLICFCTLATQFQRQFQLKNIRKPVDSHARAVMWFYCVIN